MNKTITVFKPFPGRYLFKYFLVFFAALFLIQEGFTQPICAGDMIPHTNTAIVIDGNIEVPWNLAPRHQITNTVIGTLPAGFVGTQWRALYDNANLYVLVEVNDNAVINANHGNWWDDDAVELYIDGDNVRGTNYDNNSFQYGFRVTTSFNADPAVHIGGNSVNNATGVVFAMIQTGAGYVMEIKVPWATVNVNGTAGTTFDGKPIGIDVAVDNNNNAGGNRQAQISTYAQTDQEFTNPQNFGKNVMTVCIAAPLSLLQTSTNPSCVGNTDATIRLNGEGGTAPYVYSIDGGATFPSATGYFGGLAPGTYHVAVKDAANVVVNGTAISITAPVNPLSVRSDTTICAGSSVSLNAAGSPNTYAWTYSPNSAATAGLSSTTGANPTATPTVTTTYTVTAQSSANLIANPGFEAGNVGFYTNYTFYNTQTIARKVYAISANPASLDMYFTSCGDHTNGAGKMMVVDGSAFNTDTVWFQTVPVVPNTSYTFSYWIQNVSSPSTPSQARTQTKINGTSLGTANAPTAFSCGNWTLVSYTWNSLANTTANIALYDLNVTGIGNDFALDDFYFNSSCPVTKNVTINIDPAPVAPSVTLVQPTCAISTGTITVTAPTTGVTYSFDNGASFGAGATSGNLNPGTHQVVVKNATGCKSPATPAMLNAAPSTPPAPVVTITQPTCSMATGAITVTSPATGVTYSFDNGISFGPSATSSPLTAGTYQVKIKNNTDGCVSSPASAIINAQPTTPLAPVITIIQPSCTLATGTITVTAPATGVTYSFNNGSSFGTVATSSPLAAGTYQVIVKNNTGACLSPATAAVINVQPATPGAPAVTITQPTCTVSTGLITVTAPLTGVSYSFDNGISFGTTVTSTSLIPGTYQIKVKDLSSTCISTAAVAVINMQPAIPAAPLVTVTQPTCTIATGTIKVNTPVSGVTYSFDNGVNFGANLTSPALPAGIYQVIIKNNIGSCISAGTVAVINTQPVTPVASFGPASLEVCQGGSFAFTDQSTPAGLITTWQWNFGDGSPITPANSQQNPVHTYLTSGNRTVTLSVTTAAGCASTTPASRNITIDTLPTAGFTAAVDCASKLVTFANTANGHGNTIIEWVWNFDDGTGIHILTNGNTFTWPYPTGGTHNVTLSVKTAFGCSSSGIFSRNISFGASPSVSFTAGNLCQSNAAATFTNTSSIADGSLMTYTWDFGDLSPVIQVTPAAPPAPVTHSYTTGGNYTVQLTATSTSGCVGSFAKIISVVNIPSAIDSIASSTHLCSNADVKVTNLSLITGSGTISKVEVFWDFPDLTNKTTDLQPANGNVYTHRYTEFGTPSTKSFDVVMRAYNVNGCFDDSLQTIILLASPEIQLAPLGNICQETAPVNISSSATEIFGLGGSGVKITGAGISNDTTFSPAIAGAGVHPVLYSYTAGNGCIANATQNITVKSTPISTFQNSYTVIQGASVILTPGSPMQPGLSYAWTPAAYLDNASSSAPTVVKPVSDLTYQLHLFSADNCVLDTFIKVSVIADFIVPNTITPNNDGIYDTWKIAMLTKYPTHRVQVFNRYGQLLYETRNYPANGWDGTYKGKSLPFGTYYYIIELGGVFEPKTGYLTIIK